MDPILAAAADWLPPVALVGSGAATVGLGRARVGGLLAQAVLVVGGALLLVYLAGGLHGDPSSSVGATHPVLVASDADDGFASEQTAMPAALALLVGTVRRRTGLVLLAAAGCGGLARVAANVDDVQAWAVGLVIAGASGLAGAGVWRLLPARVVETVTGAP